MSFSLGPWLANSTQNENPSSSLWLEDEAGIGVAYAIHGRFGARVALLQSPIPRIAMTKLRNKT
jgi:hypothetical protein